MNGPKTLPSQSKRHPAGWTTGLLWASPWIVFTILMVAGVVVRSRAASTITSYREQLRVAGLPANMTQATHRLETFDKTHSATWQQIARAADAAVEPLQMGEIYTDFPIQLCSDAAWQFEALTRRVVADSQPIIEAIGQCDSDGNPTWLPVYIIGPDSTIESLTHQRKTQRLLSAHFRLAIHDGDTERATQMLRLIAIVADAYQWSNTMASTWINTAVRRSANQLIAESLACGIWSTDELRWLDDYVQSNRPNQDQWRQTLVGEFMLLNDSKDFSNTRLDASLASKISDARQWQTMMNSLATPVVDPILNSSDQDPFIIDSLLALPMLPIEQRFDSVDEIRNNMEAWYWMGQDTADSVSAAIAIAEEAIENGEMPEQVDRILASRLQRSNTPTNWRRRALYQRLSPTHAELRRTFLVRDVKRRQIAAKIVYAPENFITISIEPASRQ